MQLWVLLTFLIWHVDALFEDQIGKSDWRRQFIGCPTQVYFDRRGKTDRYLVATSENVLASLTSTAGDIAWRRVQEAPESVLLNEVPLTFAVHSSVICAVADKGRVVRIWSKKDGALSGQLLLSTNPSQHSPSIMVHGDVCFVSAHNKLTAISVKTATKLWEVETQKSDWTALVAHNGGVAFVGGLKEMEKFYVKWMDSKGMQTLNRILDTPLFDKKRVVLADRYVVGFHDSTLYFLDILADGPDMQIEVMGLDSTILEVIPLSASSIGVRTISRTLVHELGKGNLLDIPSPSHSMADIKTTGGVRMTAVASDSGVISVYDLRDSSLVMKAVISEESQRAPIQKMILTPGERDWELLSIAADCRMEQYVIDISKKTVNLEWSREEGLSTIASLEMLDLPLSEAQAAIETEFSDSENNVISSLLRRLLSQLDQLRRLITRTVNDVFNVGTLIQMRTSSFSDLLKNARTAAKSSSSSRGQPLERDVFNLRKLVLATTLSGSVFALDNSDGSVVWRRYLGERLNGISNIEGQVKIPILVQRTTAFYNFDAQVAVAYKNNNGIVRLVFLNPMNGNVLGTKEVQNVKRVDLVPFVGDEHLHSVIVVETSGQVVAFPPIRKEVWQSALPVHLADIDAVSGLATGYRVDFNLGLLVKTWTSSLGLTDSSKIVAVRGKPASQRTHSQGRVMIDRSVLYKFVDPNLLAIASVDAKASTLTITLIDAVSGQIVHTARLNKASGPVHLVHCENWVAYSYWSEKGRRTEIGVIELFEGNEVTDTKVFDSLAPRKVPPHSEQASFIFSQGIHAMEVSETEQGASHRALVVALPFGNIFEVSRRFLDALRPMELTAEMREEGGWIPYMPEIPIATEDMVNYNQTVHNIRGIKTASSGLESTSLMLAYGLDLFYTRMTPSGTFDILKDDFDHVLITIVLAGLLLASFVCRRLARNKALQQQWA